MSNYYSDPNRFVCHALDEMRDCLELLDFGNIDKYKSHMAMMIEEVQTLVNIMEMGLADKKGINEIKAERRKLKKQLIKLKDQIAKLGGDDEKLD